MLDYSLNNSLNNSLNSINSINTNKPKLSDLIADGEKYLKRSNRGSYLFYNTKNNSLCGCALGGAYCSYYNFAYKNQDLRFYLLNVFNPFKPFFGFKDSYIDIPLIINDYPELSKLIDLVDLLTVVEKYTDLETYSEFESILLKKSAYHKSFMILHKFIILLNDKLNLSISEVAKVVKNLGY